ncbi:MAG TPA: hypothetical protein VGK19_09560 [Capsulimonadaceae bacterium]
MTTESCGQPGTPAYEEKAFVNAFIARDKRDRYTQLLSNPKRRKDILRCLYHTLDLLPESITTISKSDKSVETIVRLLKDKGAKNECYVISPNGELDQRILPLREMLVKLIRDDDVAILLCIPGHLAFYKAELWECLLESVK